VLKSYIRELLTRENIIRFTKFFLSTVFIVGLTLYGAHLYEELGRANLNIENVSYRIMWMGEVDPDTSEILNADRFRVHVFTTVSNSRSADYSAIIYNAEYTIYDGERAVSHWVSNNDQIDILPGDSFLYSDFCDEIHLEPGKYTLRSRIEYKDAKDERTPLEFTATVLIDKIPIYSKIIDNRDW